MKLPRWMRAAGAWLIGLVTGRSAGGGPQLQTAALPWRCTPHGQVEILLVTSRETGRWLVPKGWPMRGRSLAEAAAQEAYEEAGVEGVVEPEPIGRFAHLKQHKALGPIALAIAVHPLRVERELPDWPEQGERTRRWFAPAEAAAAVASPELAKLIDGFAAACRARCKANAQ